MTRLLLASSKLTNCKCLAPSPLSSLPTPMYHVPKYEEYDSMPVVLIKCKLSSALQIWLGRCGGIACTGWKVSCPGLYL